MGSKNNLRIDALKIASKVVRTVLATPPFFLDLRDKLV